MSKFNDFNLDEKLIKIISEIKYESPTAVQEQAIPKILSGVDLIASAQTGTGKTGAFMLPILHCLAKPGAKSGGPKALVLAPTRELALQISEETKKYTKYLPHIKTVCIYGGVPYPEQKRALSRGYDILVATPGRLIDLIERKQINLSQLQWIVLDEADRMLDMGFVDAVEEIVSFAPKKRQTLLFSATIDNRVLSFSKKLQDNPFEMRIKPDLEIKNNIEQQLYYVDDVHHKIRLLDHILENTVMTQIIVFASTINQTNKLVDYLQEKGHSSEGLHGDMNQRQRTRTINKLRKGSIQILVATDVAARGIDIASLSHVINFDLPFKPEDFIHRIGRTGRAGAKGIAITFSTFREESMLSHIARIMGKPLNLCTVAGMEPKPKEKNYSSERFRSKPRRPLNGPSRPSPLGHRRDKVRVENKRRPNAQSQSQPKSFFRDK